MVGGLAALIVVAGMIALAIDLLFDWQERTPVRRRQVAAACVLVLLVTVRIS